MAQRWSFEEDYIVCRFSFEYLDRYVSGQALDLLIIELKEHMKCGSYCATDGCDYLSEWSYHTGGTSDCQHKSVCEICHHEYGKLGDHIPKAEWQNDADSHWKGCSLCEVQRLETAPHADEDSDGKCDVCGYATSDPEDTETGSGTQPGTETDPDESNPNESDSDETSDDGGCAGGCGSSVGMSIIALVAVITGACLMSVRKKED